MVYLIQEKELKYLPTGIILPYLFKKIKPTLFLLSFFKYYHLGFINFILKKKKKSNKEISYEEIKSSYG